jgi:type II secretory pathway component PulM
MDIAALFFTFAVLILVGAYLYAPFLRGYGRRITQEEHELSMLLAERDRVLNTLQELDFDFKLGKIPAEEYPTQRASLLQKGADILRKMDDMIAKVETQNKELKTAKKPAGKKKVSDDALEAMISRRRGERKNRFDGFCPKCGKPVVATDRFCPSCGKALK